MNFKRHVSFLLVCMLIFLFGCMKQSNPDQIVCLLNAYSAEFAMFQGRIDEGSYTAYSEKSLLMKTAADLATAGFQETAELNSLISQYQLACCDVANVRYKTKDSASSIARISDQEPAKTAGKKINDWIAAQIKKHTRP